LFAGIGVGREMAPSPIELKGWARLDGIRKQKQGSGITLLAAPLSIYSGEDSEEDSGDMLGSETDDECVEVGKSTVDRVSAAENGDRNSRLIGQLVPDAGSDSSSGVERAPKKGGSGKVRRKKSARGKRGRKISVKRRTASGAPACAPISTRGGGNVKSPQVGELAHSPEHDELAHSPRTW
jgi:hypothetical protein